MKTTPAGWTLTTANEGICVSRRASAWALASSWIRNLTRQFSAARRQRTLCLQETLPLGEKRFLALIACDGERFLIGGTGSTLSLLARLGEKAQPHTAADAPQITE